MHAPKSGVDGNSTSLLDSHHISLRNGTVENFTAFTTIVFLTSVVFHSVRTFSVSIFVATYLPKVIQGGTWLTTARTPVAPAPAANRTPTYPPAPTYPPPIPTNLHQDYPMTAPGLHMPKAMHQPTTYIKPLHLTINLLTDSFTPPPLPTNIDSHERFNRLAQQHKSLRDRREQLYEQYNLAPPINQPQL